MDVGEHLVDRLLGYGIRRVFGCPGGQTLPLYAGIAKHPAEIQHVLMRDERSAAFAADAYARATGRVGVCDATVGPGASNLVSGLVEAYSSSIPVMAIVSDIPRAWEHRRRLGSASQGFEQRRFLEGCVKWYGRVETPESLDEILHACLRIATSGRPGPVVLEIPEDVFSGPARAGGFPTSAAWASFPRLRPAPDPEAIEQAAAQLRRSRRPMIVAGGGAVISRAHQAVRELAEVLGCPLATTVGGKGLVPETHPLASGVAGRFGIPMANQLLAESDCVVFIGTKTGQTTTSNWERPALDVSTIHVDVDPEEIGRNYHSAVGIWADASLGTMALVTALRGREATSGWDHARISEMQRQWWEGPIGYREAPKAGIVKPQAVMRTIRRLMSPGDTIVADASLASGWAAGRWRYLGSGRHFFAPRGLAGLGWGLPAAIGVAAAKQDEQQVDHVVCVAGDGGWGYSMAEVETAARMGLPVISVVLNNSALAWIKHSAARRNLDIVSEHFAEVSYAEAAKAMGATAWHVDDGEAFEQAFRSALAATATNPQVIEVRSCDVETPVQDSSSNAEGAY